MSRVVCLLLVIAACSSPSPPSAKAPIANALGADRPDLPAVRLYGGGSTAVAQWGTEQACHLGILSAATPVAEITYTPAALRFHVKTPCGPVAVFDGALYFVESGRVARWADGATTTVMKTTNDVVDISLVAVNKSLVYIFVQELVGVAVFRFDGTTLQPVTNTSYVTGSPVVVGGHVVVASNALISIHETEVTSLREFKDGEELPHVVGTTATEIALCERGVLHFVPLTHGGARATTHNCGSADLVVADSVFTPTFPLPATLVQTSLATGDRRVLATSKREIANVVVTTDWIYFVEYGSPNTGLYVAGRIARVPRR